MDGLVTIGSALRAEPMLGEILGYRVAWRTTGGRSYGWTAGYDGRLCGRADVGIGPYGRGWEACPLETTARTGGWYPPLWI